jgi:hypothetical protein
VNKRILFSIGLIVLVLSSCSVGSRRVVTEDVKVSNFDQVNFSAVGELTITQGDRESLTIEAESNVMNRIETSVRGGTLHIDMRTGGFPWIGNVVPTKPVKYDLTVKELNSLDLSGLGNVYAGAIDTDRLNLDLSGAGQVIIRSLTADSLEVEHTGLGKCELSGQVTRQEVRLTGAGEYDAADLESEKAEVVLTGLGKATVWATETLDIELTGAGSVSYYGNPRVTQNVTGLGNVKSLGSR